MMDASMPGARRQKLIHEAAQVLLRTYRPQPAVMVRGHGMYVWDAAETRYLDMTAGVAVCALGHSHPALSQAIADQAGRLMHISNLFCNEEQILAARALLGHCFPGRVFFGNSGSEANEAALKLARRFQQRIAGRPERTVVVATKGSFHGRTIGALSVTGQDHYRQGFGSLWEAARFVDFGDVQAMARALEPGDVCAIIVEPIQGDGGVVTPPAGYLTALRALADGAGAVLIFDEVQTGFGRTGTWFAYQHEGAVPDVMTLAKGMGGGVPIGAMVAHERVAPGLERTDADVAAPHASTFGGNPLACAAARTVMECLARERLLERAQEMGALLGERLESLVAAHGQRCVEARGRGLLRGLALSEPAAPIVNRCRERGLLVSAVARSVIRFTPPLIVEREHIDQAVSILDEVLRSAPQAA